MSETPAMVENQINQNLSELAAQMNMLVQTPVSSPHHRIIRSRIRQLNSANYQWNLSYKRLTGKPYFEHVEFSDAQIKSNKVAKDRKVQLDRKKFQRDLLDAIEKLELEVGNLNGQLKSLNRLNSTKWASGFVHFFSGAYWLEPEFIRKDTVPAVKLALREARIQLSSGQLGEARAYLQKAIHTLTEGWGRLHAYRKDLGIGGQRTITAVKTVKAVLVTLASGGANLTPGTAAGIEALSTGVEEGTMLALAAGTGDSVVTLKDVQGAVAKTILDAGGKYVGGRLGKSIESKLLTRLTGPLAKQNAQAIGAAVAEYVATNFKQIILDAAKVSRGQKPSPEFIARLLIPGLKSVPGLGVVGDVISETELLQTVSDSVAGK